MLLLLPLVTFLAVWTVTSRARLGAAADHDEAWRPGFLGAAVVWGAFLSLSGELLGFFHHLDTWATAAAWSLAMLLSLVAAWRSGGLTSVLHAASALRNMRLRLSVETLAAVGLSVSLAVLGLLAWISPPNTTDALQYHLPRVVEWAQRASLGFFPTAYYPQLWNAIWSEEANLHFLLLLGSDQASNLLQWFSLVGSIVATTALARLLGAGRKGQWLAAACVISLPVGILESTSAQTDFVAGFWLVAFAYFVVLSSSRKLRFAECLLAWAALGLGLLTKATLFAFALPPAVWLMVETLRGTTRAQWAGRLILGPIVILVLNLGYWGRNLAAFGGPLGTMAWVGQKTGGVLDPGRWITGPLRQVLLNLATPSEAVNRSITAVERGVEVALGAQSSPFRVIWNWNHEDLAPNPVHLLLIGLCLLTVFWMLLRRRDETRPALFVFAAMASASALLFAWVANFDVYGVRYQLPGFLLFAPIIGTVAERRLPSRFADGLIMALLLLAWPWILLNQTRPLISWQPRTSVDSILTTSREKVLFANWPHLREPYLAAGALVGASDCDQVGLVLDSHDPEYLLWATLGAPENGMRLEILDPLSASARYMDPTFAPCAVMCTICGADRAEWEGLPLAGDFGAVRVYLEPPVGEVTRDEIWRQGSP